MEPFDVHPVQPDEDGLYNAADIIAEIRTAALAEQRRQKHRESTEYEALLRRLNRIEGQVRGVRGMVEKEAYCTDILTQVSAIQSALNAFSKELLSSHIHTCVVRDIQAGRLEAVDELVNTIQKLMK